MACLSQNVSARYQNCSPLSHRAVAAGVRAQRRNSLLFRASAFGHARCVGLDGKLLALVASLVLAFTGGTLKVDLSTPVPTVTICSAHGSYEVPLGEPSDRDVILELCCGACVAVDAPDPWGVRPWTPELSASSEAIVLAVRSFALTAPLWREPPSRAPPFFV